MMKTIASAAVLAGGISLAVAETEKATPLAAYAESVLYATALCPMMLEMASQSGNSNEPGKTDWNACIDDAKKAIKTHYAAALKTVSKPAAKAALKEHYIVATSAITAMAPGANEIRMNYNRRQAENNQRLNERWARFEVEN